MENIRERNCILSNYTWVNDQGLIEFCDVNSAANTEFDPDIFVKIRTLASASWMAKVILPYLKYIYMCVCIHMLKNRII